MSPRPVIPAALALLLVLSLTACKHAVPDNVAATVNGRVITYADLDKQYQMQFMSSGEKPSEDQAMLAGQDPMRTDPLLALLPGGAGAMPLLQELGAALIAYTPPSFETICCQITEGVEQGQRALFYTISCPQFPDEGTTIANDRVHQAATRLVQQMAPAQGGFQGIVVTLTMQKDGSWRHNLKMLSHAAA